eukprot:m.20448 g.20448  ORF g.20448 m.20448 type:complete len:66 (-) comp10214_c0_seq1:255-452(-)
MAVGIPLKWFSEALELAGVAMPMDNNKKCFFETLVLGSVAEATKVIHANVEKALITARAMGHRRI